MTSKSPAYCRSTAYRAFAGALGRVDRPGGLFRAAWAIAQHELPEADLASGEAAIDGLAAAVMKRVRSPSVDARLAHLHDVVFDVAGFRGNVEDYYAVGNSYLPEVLRTRRGLPIALALVYQCVAAKSGLVVHGVNAPGHFLVEVETPSQRGAQSMYVDPFHGGRLLTVAEALVRIDESTGHELSPKAAMLVRATPRQWLRRMLHNLQAVFAAGGRERDVFAMQELEQLMEEKSQ